MKECCIFHWIFMTWSLSYPLIVVTRKYLLCWSAVTSKNQVIILTCFSANITIEVSVLQQNEYSWQIWKNIVLFIEYSWRIWMNIALFIEYLKHGNHFSSLLTTNGRMNEWIMPAMPFAKGSHESPWTRDLKWLFLFFSRLAENILRWYRESAKNMLKASGNHQNYSAPRFPDDFSIVSADSRYHLNIFSTSLEKNRNSHFKSRVQGLPAA